MPRFVKLTRQAIRLLQPGHRLIEHGLCAERLANQDVRWSVNIMVDGQRIHRVIGRESDGTTRTQVEQFIEQARTAARQTRLQLPKGRKLSITIADAATEYIQLLGLTTQDDKSKRKARLTQHILPILGDRRLMQLSPVDIERYKTARTTAGARAGTINRELMVLSHLCSKAVEWGWILTRPVQFRLLREDPPPNYYLTIPEIQRLQEAASHQPNEQLYPFVVIAVGTSMRRSEILSIRKEHIDLARGVIHIPQAKSGPRDQPMTQDLVAYLAAYLPELPEDTPWLFPSRRSRSGHTQNLEKSWARMCQDAGLNPRIVTRHMLRHTTITHLVQSGVDLPTVQKISGHKSFAMVLRYAHQNAQHIGDALNKLSRRYRGGGK